MLRVGVVLALFVCAIAFPHMRRLEEEEPKSKWDAFKSKASRRLLTVRQTIATTKCKGVKSKIEHFFVMLHAYDFEGGPKKLAKLKAFVLRGADNPGMREVWGRLGVKDRLQMFWESNVDLMKKIDKSSEPVRHRLAKSGYKVIYGADYTIGDKLLKYINRQVGKVLEKTNKQMIREAQLIEANKAKRVEKATFVTKTVEQRNAVGTEDDMLMVGETLVKGNARELRSLAKELAHAIGGLGVAKCNFEDTLEL
jgi:hypothetical protein